MANTKETIEQRKHRRFKVEDGAFAVPRPRSAVMGKIIDISLGGLTFGYMENQGKVIEPFELTIAMRCHGFKLDKVPCKIITDRQSSADSPEIPAGSRRCSVQFGDMTTSQIEKLEYFIRKHTTNLI